MTKEIGIAEIDKLEEKPPEMAPNVEPFWGFQEDLNNQN